MTQVSKTQSDFAHAGFTVCKNALGQDLLDSVRADLIALAHLLTGKHFASADACWNYFRAFDRKAGSTFYNGFKHLPSVHQISASAQIIEALKHGAGMSLPALVDVNCRIDANGEDKFLFDWHQDYWFSVCSPQAVVVWIPVEAISEETGSLELISNAWTDGRIFKTRAGDVYHSYADAVVLDDSIPTERACSATGLLDRGDILLFKFNTLHKSEPVRSGSRSRFTIQLRFADYGDPEFQGNCFKPGVVNSRQVDFLVKEGQK